MKKQFTMSLCVLLGTALLTGCGSLSGTAKGKEYVTDASSSASASASVSTSSATAATSINPSDISEPDIAASAVSAASAATAVSISTMDDSALNIVFLGDSQFDNARGTGSSIPELVAQKTGGNCYNLAVGGTAASLSREQKNIGYDQWTDPNFTGVVNVLAGNVSSGIFGSYAAGSVLSQIDVKKVDYYVIDYGVNDYFNGTQIFNQDENGDQSTYVGAMRTGLSNLKNISPNAKIVICSPAYALFYNGDHVFIGDGNMVDKGAGPLKDYASSAQNLASESGALYLDTYYGTAFDLDQNTADQFLQDGIHFTERGRRVYATALARIINKDLGTDTSEPSVLQIESSDFN